MRPDFSTRQRITFALIGSSMIFTSVGISSMAGVHLAQATTLTINDNGDGSTCSSDKLTLRCALSTVNDGDTITFNLSSANKTITLTSALPDITKSITIDGSNSGNQIAVDGANEFSVFNIPNSDTIVFLQNLIVEHGNKTNFGGGAITNSGMLTISNSTLFRNSANVGGGVFNTRGATLTITLSTLSDNLVTYDGGAIDNSGTLTISNSTLYRNIASSESGADGGAIFNELGGTLTINSSTFSGNSASSYGAVVYNDGILSIGSSTISGNIATPVTGGVVYNNGTMTISSSTLSSNSAAGAVNNRRMMTISYSTISGNSGGGVGNDGTLTISNSTISGNSATSSGGGVSSGGGTLTISNSTIFGNSAYDGGGLYIYKGTVNLFSTIVAGNTLTSANARNPDISFYSSSDVTDSGAVNSLGYNLIGDGANVSGIADGTKNDQVGTAASLKTPNLATLANNGGPTQTMSILLPSPASGRGNCNGALSSNIMIAPVTTDQRGEGYSRKTPCDIGAFEVDTCVAVASTTLTVTSTADNGPNTLRCAVRNANAARSTFTINFSLPPPHTIMLTSGELDINGTNTNPIIIDGGADGVIIDGNHNGRIFNIPNAGATVLLQNLIIRTGKVIGAGNGGAIANSGTLTISNSNFCGNSTTYTTGGGVFNLGTLTISNSTFSRNSASGDKGGAVNNGGTLTIRNSTFSGNHAASGGGVFNLGTLTISNSTFSDNSSAIGGGGVDNEGGTLTINDSTLSHNLTGYGGGGGVFSVNSTLTISSSTFSSNSTQGNGGGAFSINSTLTIRNSTFSGNSALSRGGGVNNDSILTISNSTFSGNSANSGGGIFNGGRLTTFNLFSSSVADNTLTGVGGNGPDIDGTVTSLGYNLIGNGTRLIGITNGAKYDQAGTTAVPNLAALANNGGPTQTQAIQLPSPAYERGRCSGYSDGGIVIAPISIDQRGQPRKMPCDIGAFENQTQTASTSINTPTATYTNTPTNMVR